MEPRAGRERRTPRPPLLWLCPPHRRPLRPCEPGSALRQRPRRGNRHLPRALRLCVRCPNRGEPNSSHRHWLGGRTRPSRTARYRPVRHCVVLHCITLHCTALHCTALHCAAALPSGQERCRGPVRCRERCPGAPAPPRGRPGWRRTFQTPHAAAAAAGRGWAGRGGTGGTAKRSRPARGLEGNVV